MAKKRLTDRQYLEQWQKFKKNISLATPVDLNETPIEKQRRIDALEKDDEAWFKYYFPNFYTSEPANFHKRATKRVMENPDWFEVRSWARELSKSGRTMMEVLKLILTGKKKNILMVSNNLDNATRLLLPYKAILESNNRIINDYGKQQSIGNWEAEEFKTQNGVAFRALGAGQSPRGTRNDAIRPDVILIDDIDTDEECRNKDRIKNKVKWVFEALYATRSISNPLLMIVCGNIIAKFCTVTELGKKADKWDIVNIRDKNGKSTWPQKNSEAAIDRVLSLMPSSSARKEYFNDPQSEGTTFKEVHFKRLPPIKSCEKLLIYGDPSPSNNTKAKNSTKSVGIIGYKNHEYYLYKVWVDHATNGQFIEWIYQACLYMDSKKIEYKNAWIENNSLQDPHYSQVLVPLANEHFKRTNYRLPIHPDKRKKPAKFERIEGTLELKNLNGQLFFNEVEKDNPHMQRMVEQMLAVSEDCKEMDGPDMLEGGVWLIENRVAKQDTSFAYGAIDNRKY
ncbi:hypothetical protein QP519_11380 [Weeksella virosa]|uniref:hypothetical protein n=1 Tax=Weeksella virosa TaxID=1014 RepID=UPI00255277B2|nr:hypothetical protein [Weeksella virosa]MDK7376134.1 hypothetical protein [Weeksella virosa]